jgi:F0F1-type ATP synthase membrane subunit a
VGNVRAAGIVSLSRLTEGYIVMPRILLRTFNHYWIKALKDKNLNSLSLSTPQVFAFYYTIILFQTIEKLLPLALRLKGNMLINKNRATASYGELIPGNSLFQYS